MKSNAVEQQWRSTIRYKKISAASVLSICGPSGVGKTIAIKTLASYYPVFIETIDGNPHLNALLKGKADFDATANQEWFLKRIGEHITRANTDLPLILDQDPAAIVLAYSRMFMEDDKISKAQYSSLLRRLLKIEEKLQNWKCPRTVLFLDAPADVLHQRVLQRSGKTHTPPLKWFDRVRNHFLELLPHFPNAIIASTVELSPQQIISRARGLIKSHT
jgi:deoxyadenosine/deoxycytidine kinase